MLNKTQLLQHYQQDYELINKIKGWCEQARRGQVIHTDFLDLRQIAILQAILAQEKISNYVIHKPLTNGFRATVSFNSSHDHTVILHAKQPTSHFFSTSSGAWFYFKPITIRITSHWQFIYHSEWFIFKCFKENYSRVCWCPINCSKEFINLND
ncbi:hypothetical protein [Spiroplasma sp. ChiS]|uniref:hypothetical protein n=1 Tax=Spiroplasma sp. ChiS TaxID=2099885 RepID=UPI001F1AACCE|nr:hypothetical protein [Spiroplasma sp. ChiS]